MMHDDWIRLQGVRGSLIAALECVAHLEDMDAPELSLQLAAAHNTVSTLLAEHEEEAAKAAKEQDARAWDEDEADMARIAREWDNFDRDPPGS